MSTANPKIVMVAPCHSWCAKRPDLDLPGTNIRTEGEVRIDRPL